jgi:hypothetical protein
LGLKQLPRELTAFEIEAFFTFTLAERQLIEDRRRPALKLGLALQIGFLRMCGRLLDAVRIVPPALWRHLGAQFGVAAPDLASLRAMYRRAPTLIEHHQLACEAIGFHWLSEPQRRALVRALRQELTRTRDRQRLLVIARRWSYDHQLQWANAARGSSRSRRPRESHGARHRGRARRAPHEASCGCGQPAPGPTTAGAHGRLRSPALPGRSHSQ